MKNVFEIAAKIALDHSDFDAGLQKASRSADTFGGKVKSGFATAAKLGGAALAAATGSALLFGGASVKAGMDFDASMSNVAAISGATAAEVDSLRDKAQEMGAKTKFSATEAADAFGYMAMAGWKTGDMLDGIEGIMNLAAASGEDLALTSDIVTDALTAFGLSAKDSGHFADVLAAASSNANTNVSMLGESFKYVAPVAGALGYSAEDTAVALGLMANSGIKASQAGTSLRSLLTRMAKPTKQSATAMDALGLSLTDSAGNMKSLGEIMQDLRKGFSKLSDAEKAQYAALLAGQEGMSGLLAIVNSSETDFDKLTDAINNSTGAAEEMAAIQLDNLAGDITLFKSALESTELAISDVLTPSLREFVQFGTDGLARLTTAFNENGLDGALEVFGELLSEGLQMIVDNLPRAIEVGGKILWAIARGIGEAIPQLIMTAIELLSKLGDYLINGVTNPESDFGGKLGQIIIKIGEFLIKAIPKLAEAALKIVAGLAMLLISAAAELVKAAVKLIAKLGEALKNRAKDLAGSAKEMVKQIVNGIANKARDIVNAGKTIIANIASGIVNNVRLVTDKIGNVITAIKTKITSVASSLLSSGREIVDKIASGIGNSFALVTNKFNDLKNRIKEKIESMAAWWVSFGYYIVKGIADGITKYAAYVINAITNLVSSAWEKVKNFFGIASPSKLMKWAGKMLDEGFASGISDNADKVADAMDELNDITAEPISGVLSSAGSSGSGNAPNYGGIVMNIYGAEGQDVNGLAEIVSRKLQTAVDRRRLTFA